MAIVFIVNGRGDKDKERWGREGREGQTETERLNTGLRTAAWESGLDHLTAQL